MRFRGHDPLHLALQLVVYVALYFVTAFVFGPLLAWGAGYLAGITATGLISAIFANWLSLRIYEQRPLVDVGLEPGLAALHNVALGIGGGIGSACLVLAPPLMAGAAHIAAADEGGNLRTALFVSMLLLFGAAGEELLFRGYGFQILMRAFGAPAAILGVGFVFAALHAANPHATWLGLVNTAGFGILFGYAFYRCRDLWMPIGLHFGWNLTLPLFGVNVSGIKMRVTGYDMQWSAGALWSGGDYGPEASLLTSAAMFALFAYIRYAPVRRRVSPLLDSPRPEEPCVPSPPPL